MEPAFEKKITPVLFEQYQVEMGKLNGVAELTHLEDLAKKISSLTGVIPDAKVCGYQSEHVVESNLRTRLKNSSPPITWIPASKPAEFDYKNHFDMLAAADFAVTTCDYLIANTGTIVFTGKNHPSRMLTLLPPAIIVVAGLNSLLPDLASLYKQPDMNNVKQQSSLVFFTGPSRTADIEKKLVLGVHGPKALTVLIFDR